MASSPDKKNKYGSAGIPFDHNDDDDEYIEIIRPSDSEATPLVSNATSTRKPVVPPEDQSRSTWSRLVFQWFVPVLHRGNLNNRLEQADLEELVPFPHECSTSHVRGVFEAHWHAELRDHGDDPSLVRALFKSFGSDFVRAGILKFAHDLCAFVGPQVLRGMIQFLRSDDAPVWHGVALTLVVTLSQVAMSLCLRHYFFKVRHLLFVWRPKHPACRLYFSPIMSIYSNSPSCHLLRASVVQTKQCYVTGLRVRSAVVLAVYGKALKLSASERHHRKLGEITNLTSIDAQRLQGAYRRSVALVCITYGVNLLDHELDDLEQLMMRYLFFWNCGLYQN